MSNIARRLEKLEKALSVGKERTITESVITLWEIDGLEDEQEQRDKLGPEETWLTYQEQLATARQDRADQDYRLIMIGLSLQRELQAREFQNSPLAEAKRAERIREYRTVLKAKLYPIVGSD